MNLDEWKKKKIADVEVTYETLKPFNPTILLDKFWDKIEVRISADTFPYDLATKVSAQLEGTGKRGQYDLTFWAWIGPMHTYHSFKIDTDEANEAVIALLKKTTASTQHKVVMALVTELNELHRNLKRYGEGQPNEYAKWQMQEPNLKGKIARVETAIAQLTEETSPSP